LVQNKPKEPINTPIAFMDLAIHIYDKKQEKNDEIIFLTDIKSW
jgi:hypothetical protein